MLSKDNVMFVQRLWMVMLDCTNIGADDDDMFYDKDVSDDSSDADDSDDRSNADGDSSGDDDGRTI